MSWFSIFSGNYAIPETRKRTPFFLWIYGIESTAAKYIQNIVVTKQRTSWFCIISGNNAIAECILANNVLLLIGIVYKIMYSKTFVFKSKKRHGSASFPVIMQNSNKRELNITSRKMQIQTNAN